MNIHNMMEEIVAQHVNITYDLLKGANTAWLSCDCENCRLDTISYVLNRVPPKYVVSGRGVNHNSNVLKDDIQLRADIDAITNEGIRLISETKRPFHALPRKDCEASEVEIPAFNFPTFSGSVLDGSNFEPISGASVLLKCDGKPVEMVDKTWVNPAATYGSTRGQYSFWIKSISTEKAEVIKKFNFSIEVSKEGYEPVIHHFEVPIQSEMHVHNELNSVYSVKIKDIVLFKNDIVDTMTRDVVLPDEEL
ncbi:MAG: late competence development ComFB family protein [Treponema sp.]|nr:late competence development ComFB family protein [Candidatus Treponema equifaecale]